MSDRITIVAEPRAVTGKKVQQLRREGWVPGIVYGRGEPVAVKMERLTLRRALRTAGTTELVDLNIEGARQPRIVLVREIQQHVTRGDVLHVDFMEVDMKTALTAEAELVGEGMAKPEEDGLGVVTLTLRSIEIECLPENLVSEIKVDLSLIQTPDDVINVADIVSPPGITILTDPDTTVARFEWTRAEEEEEEEEVYAPAADSVEVITRVREEEELEE